MEMVKLLLDHGSRVHYDELKSRYGGQKQPIDLAVVGGSVDIVKIMLEKNDEPER